MRAQLVKTDLGELVIHSVGNTLTGLEFDAEKYREAESPEESLAKRVESELQHYFVDSEYQPELMLDPAGTDFQKRVWRALRDIPPGSVETYGSLAKKLDSSPRAVGNACRANPIPIVIPCHRVVSAKGLGGFMGATKGDKMQIKLWLLKHEGVLV